MAKATVILCEVLIPFVHLKNGLAYSEGDKIELSKTEFKNLKGIVKEIETEKEPVAKKKK